MLYTMGPRIISVLTLAGYTDGHVPVMDAEDTVEVFLLKAPVWEAKFGDLLAHFVSTALLILRRVAGRVCQRILYLHM